MPIVDEPVLRLAGSDCSVVVHEATRLRLWLFGSLLDEAPTSAAVSILPEADGLGCEGLLPAAARSAERSVVATFAI